MSARLVFLISTLVPLSPCVARAQSDPATQAAREWWNAFAHGDTAKLKAYSTDSVKFTASIGRLLTQNGLMIEATSHASSAHIPMEWSESSVVRMTPNVAVVTQRVVEGAGTNAAVYRYLAVLEQRAGSWRVVAGQSTRETVLAPRASAEVHGPLNEYAGEYRTPRNAIMLVLVRDGGLVLIEPSGVQTALDAIGPGIFESSQIPFTGVLRFVFARDSTGRVSSLSRVTGAVVTFTRVR